jgi:hypothetical protein
MSVKELGDFFDEIQIMLYPDRCILPKSQNRELLCLNRQK